MNKNGCVSSLSGGWICEFDKHQKCRFSGLAFTFLVSDLSIHDGSSYFLVLIEKEGTIRPLLKIPSDHNWSEDYCMTYSAAKEAAK